MDALVENREMFEVGHGVLYGGFLAGVAGPPFFELGPRHRVGGSVPKLGAGEKGEVHSQ